MADHLQNIAVVAEETFRLAGTIHDYRHQPVVYYMRMDRLVKIGTTTNLLMRTNTIMPQGVLAVEWGGYYEERGRHGQFWNHHSHGEWYWMHEALWTHIQQLRDAAPVKLGCTVERWLQAHGIKP